ncbi:MAG: zinc-ribbon domain-containing protein [Defluviitaleaceae bacterium]|nr:zinc-ribbon domain-containing protein [Defluviitaleaceae bacterium]
MRCTQCGHGVEVGDAFCESWGKKIDFQNNTAPCKHCGYAVEDGDPFCENCGKPQSVSKPSPVAPVRMPLIFILDTSSTAFPYISQLNASLNRFKGEACNDTQTSDVLDVAVVQFNNDFNVLQNFTSVGKMNPIRLISGGQANYDAPIREALQMAEAHSRSVNTYKPWIVFISCGEPSDNIVTISAEIKNAQNADRLRFIALGAGGYNSSALKQLTDIVFKLDGADFSSFFNWINQCMGAIARSAPGTKPQLPSLQGNIYRDV